MLRDLANHLIRLDIQCIGYCENDPKGGVSFAELHRVEVAVRKSGIVGQSFDGKSFGKALTPNHSTIYFLQIHRDRRMEKAMADQSL